MTAFRMCTLNEASHEPIETATKGSFVTLTLWKIKYTILGLQQMFVFSPTCARMLLLTLFTCVWPVILKATWYHPLGASTQWQYEGHCRTSSPIRESKYRTLITTKWYISHIHKYIRPHWCACNYGKPHVHLYSHILMWELKATTLYCIIEIIVKCF